MGRKFKVEEVLDEIGGSARADYEALLRRPTATLTDAIEFFAERGFKLSQTTVWSHRKNFEEVLKGVRQSAELARAFSDVAKGEGIAGLSDAAVGRFQQLLMEKLFQLSADDDLDAGELMKLSIALKSAVGAKQQIEELKAGYEKQHKEAVAAAEKAAKNGDGAEAVVSKVREILGIAS